jgi:tRNA threonylcarbamoyladenosine modification (KEOPS) complex  Pcc1 subunit
VAARGTLGLACDSEAEARALEAALAGGEAGDDVPGSRARVERDGARLTVRVEAEDAGALRAAVNAHLRWLRVAADVHALARR